MEPTLMVIGLNHRTAPLAMRERFFIGENRRYEVLRKLKSAEGIEEIVVLSTCCRTEFLVWASEPTLAANSLLQFLGAEHGLKLSEWQHFYRLLDEAAFVHIFRVTSGLDCLALGEPQVVVCMKTAWQQAQTVGAAGRFLNATVEMALSVSERVRTQTSVSQCGISIASAARELACQIFGSLENRRVLLMGTGKTSEIAARQMVEHGAGSVVVIDQSATERIADERNRVALVILDVGIPRDVDPEVRRVDGILLYDLEGLERAIRGRGAERSAAAAQADEMIVAEARAFSSKLKAQMVVPTGVALRQRLEEICRQELESFIEERGPFTREQDQSLHAITAQVIQKIASSLDRELKELPEKEEQERMTEAVTRLFHLEPPQTALAGTRLDSAESNRASAERPGSDRRREKRNEPAPIAINY